MARTTMKAWQFTSASGGLEKNLFLPATGAPKPRITDTQVLVEVYSAALNPVDHKVPEMGMLSKASISSPSIPGMDFCGRVAEAGNKMGAYRIGEKVFGTYSGPQGRGSLAQYVAVERNMLAPLPDGVGVDDAASIGVVGLTALQALRPHVKKGDKVFVNGGSGGTGVLTIQVAKALGCYVTTSCSAANVELCRSLGADDVLDYKAADVVKQLKSKGQIFSLVVDNIGSPSNLYRQSDAFLARNGRFVQVGISPSLGAMTQVAANILLPRFLGGGSRKFETILAKARSDDLRLLAKWLKDGRIRAVIDEVFEFDDVPRAFEKLKVGRTKGKIVIKVRSG